MANQGRPGVSPRGMRRMSATRPVISAASPTTKGSFEIAAGSIESVRALPILYRRGIRYVKFQGGEPLLHPDIVSLVEAVRAAGIRPASITNGWLLPQKIENLASAGLGTILVSIATRW